MKLPDFSNNRFSPFLEGNSNVPGQDPFSFMVAPVSDRTPSVTQQNMNASSLYRPKPRPFKPMKSNNPFLHHHDEREFHHVPHPDSAFHRRMNDDRLAAHADQYQKHPGMYAKHARFASTKNHHHRQTTTNHFTKNVQNRRLNPSAAPFVPTVAAHHHRHDSSFPSARPSAQRPTQRSQQHHTAPARPRSLFPFNTRMREPTERHDAFKHDVWQRFDSRDRSDYHRRLNDSRQVVNQHLHHRRNDGINHAIGQIDQPARKIYRAKRPEPVVHDKPNTTNRDNRAPFAPPDSNRYHAQRFSVKHFSVGSNNVCNIVAHSVDRPPLSDHVMMLKNLVNLLKNHDIILIIDGPHTTWHHDSLVTDYFFNKSIAILPFIVTQRNQEIEFMLNDKFSNFTHGPTVYSNNRLRLPPQRSRRDRPFLNPHGPPQYAFMATGGHNLRPRPPRDPTDNAPSASTAPAVQPNGDPDGVPPPVNETIVQPPTPEEQLLRPPPRLETPVETVEDDDAQSLQVEDLPSWEPAPSYRESFRPPTPPRRDPSKIHGTTYQGNTEDPIGGWDDEPSSGSPSEMKEAEDDDFSTNTKLKTSVEPGIVPTLDEYTLMAITTYLESLPQTLLNNPSDYVARQEIPIFQHLVDILVAHVHDERYHNNLDDAGDVLILIQLVGEIGAIAARAGQGSDSFARYSFPRDYRRYLGLFRRNCMENGVYLPTLPFPEFPEPVPAPATGTANLEINLIDLTLSPQRSPQVVNHDNWLQPPQENKTHVSKSLPVIVEEQPSCPTDDVNYDEDHEDPQAPPKKSAPKSLDRPPSNFPPHRRNDEDDDDDFDGFPPRRQSTGRSHSFDSPTKRHYNGGLTDDESPPTPPKKSKTESSSAEPEPKVSGDLTSRLLKAAKNVGMKPLDMVSDPTLRRTRFNTWSTLLRIVLSSQPETESMFADANSITKLNDKVDACVFQLILAKCGSTAMSSIESSGTTSGFEAFTNLRRQCAQVNESLQSAAFQALLNVRWSDSETASAFLVRYHSLLNKCQHLGLKFNEKDKVRFFFGATHRLSRASPYYVRMELLNSRREYHQDTLTLADVESNLYAFDEEMNNNKLASSTRKAYKEENALFTQRSSNQQTNKHKQSRPEWKPHNPNATCGYCGRIGHFTRDCLKKQREQRITAPDADDKRPQRNRLSRDRSSGKSRSTRYGNRDRRSDNQRDHPKGQSKTPICFKCNQPGHYAPDCPNPRQGSTHKAPAIEPCWPTEIWNISRLTPRRPSTLVLLHPSKCDKQHIEPQLSIFQDRLHRWS